MNTYQWHRWYPLGYKAPGTLVAADSVEVG
jgi:hypothetical protein